METDLSDRSRTRLPRVLGPVALLAAVLAASLALGTDAEPPADTVDTAVAQGEASTDASGGAPSGPVTGGADATTQQPAPDEAVEDPARTDHTPVPADTDVDQTVRALLARIDAALASPEDGVDALAEVASGALLTEIRTQLTELEAEGRRQQGRVTVVELTTEASDDAATVVACLDRSTATVLDANGQALPTSGPDRVAHTFSLQRTADRWTVTERGFPDDPTC